MLSDLDDLEADPRELVNQWGAAPYAAAQAQMQFAMLDWLTATSDITPLAEDARGLPPSPVPPFPWPPWPTHSPKQKFKLG